MKPRKKIGTGGWERTAIKRRLLVETLCDRRVLAALHGVVFDDVDHSWRLESGETGLGQRLVFVDENNSGLPDDGERFVLTDFDGSFAFDELGGDEQIVRLLSRSLDQVQHFPFAVDSLVDNQRIDLSASELFPSVSQLDLVGPLVVLSADQGLIRVELPAGNPAENTFLSRPTGTAMLPDGRLLVLASDGDGNEAFVIRDDELEPVDLLLTQSGQADVLPSFSGWASVAIDASGDGVLVPQSAGESAVALRRLSVGDEIVSAATGVFVPAGTTVVGGGSATSVIVEPNEAGLALSLWSNSTATLISPTAVVVDGAETVLGYSDDSGLAFAWVPGDDGADAVIQVLDADANFAVLQTLDELDDLVAVDTKRSVVFSLSSSATVLRAIDAVTAETIGRWELLPGLEQASEMAIAPGGDQLVILVAGGIATIALNRIDAHRVRTDGVAPTYPLRFAARLVGENSPPRYQSVPRFVATQGTTLILGDGALKQGAIDDDGDSFVVVRTSDPIGGTVRITPGGGLTYNAFPGFVGIDSFDVFLHDGIGPSAVTTIEIDVLPPVQPTIEVVVNVNPVPENAVAGFVAATIQIIGSNNRPLVFTVGDPRFIVTNNQILVAQPGTLDYEENYLIATTLTGSDPLTGEVLTLTAFSITLTDENDPITDIQPRQATVEENSPGATIAELVVEDQDADEQYTFEVSDDRFEVVGQTLKLRDGVSLDFETEPEVVLNIVARDTRGGAPFGIDFVVTVIDVEDAEVLITLSNASVIEYARGSTIGAVSVIGPLPWEEYSLAVDDSRFEIVGATLKLRDGLYLIRADQQEARVVISATSLIEPHVTWSETFSITVLANSNPFHNPESPYDVNGDDEVTPLDALLILNAISQNGAAGPIEDFPLPGRYWDVNGDGWITPLDALLILNYLNVQSRPRPTGEPESDPGSDTVQSNDPVESTYSDETVGLNTPFTPAEGEAYESSTSARPALADPVPPPQTARTAGENDLAGPIPQPRIAEIRGDWTTVRERLLRQFAAADQNLLERLDATVRRLGIDDSATAAIDRLIARARAVRIGDLRFDGSLAEQTAEVIDRALLAIESAWSPNLPR